MTTNTETPGWPEGTTFADTDKPQMQVEIDFTPEITKRLDQLLSLFEDMEERLCALEKKAHEHAI